MTLPTAFLVPKPFLGLDGIHQRNTLAFLRAAGFPVLILGDEAGTHEAARDFGAIHLPDLPRNVHGTPRLDAAFRMAASGCEGSHLLYLNADILLPPDSARRFAGWAEAHPEALFSGSRVDLDLPQALDPGQWPELAARGHTKGIRRYPAAMDFFLFPKAAFAAMPAFAIGRPGWDNWMVYEALREGRSVIDLGGDLLVLHQNHGYGHIPGGDEAYRNGPESRENRHLAGGYLHLYNLRDATHALRQGMIRRRFRLSPYPLYRLLMHATTGSPRLRDLLRALMRPFRR